MRLITTAELGNARLLGGDRDLWKRSIEAWTAVEIDETREAPVDWSPATHRTTLGAPFYVTGPSTYSRKERSTLHFEPAKQEGWWIDRTDLEEQLPIRVSVRNVWDTKRSIVLRSGSAHNYLRMIEHIIALRLGIGLDDAMVRVHGGDPPLFNAGSAPIIDAIRQVGLVTNPDRPLTYWTVKEPVTLMGPSGSFLHVSPPEEGNRKLSIDCAIDFDTVIGQQRIRFDVWDGAFHHGAHARTNCKRFEWWFVRSAGKLFADIRNLGYTGENILIAGRNSYANEAKLMHNDKSLEAVWHRATLDLVAALSLVEKGRLAADIVSYKAGHALDVRLITHLYKHDLLTPLP
ncbi:MAG: UDP-3-O-acyl-N-acetylglucosamine deacetylase [Lentisphaeria bacterium]|nr:UDP-3-O-acyl-N-acetylglucosamine deacetylase [Lentisphaeria bacterium]